MFPVQMRKSASATTRVMSTGVRFCCPHVYAVRRIGVDTTNGIIDRTSGQMPLFFLCMVPMGAERKDNGHIFPAAAGRDQFIEHGGQDLITRDWPGNIACNNGDFLPGLCESQQPRRADRMHERIPDASVPTFLCRIGLDSSTPIRFFRAAPLPVRQIRSQIPVS